MSIARAFVALRPPEGVLDDIVAAVEAARAGSVGWRFASREQWHVTLAFLGVVPEETALSVALGVLAEAVGFRIRLGSSGAFPSCRRARVAWLGVGEGASEVAALAQTLGRAVAPLGFKVERRFHPHLTVARAREPLDASAVLAALGGGFVGSGWTVGEVALYESRLGPGGARYTVRDSFALAGDG